MNISELRKKYLPKHVSVLFVAEAVPDSPDRFFYYDKVTEKDWLYLYLMRVLYGEMETSYLRINKAKLLAKFKYDGYYLIDAVDDPITGKMSSDVRTAMVRANSAKKLTEIKSLLSTKGNANTKVVLIKTTVFDGLYQLLMTNKIPVINKSSIYFPSNGRQSEFLEQMHATLSGS